MTEAEMQRQEAVVEAVLFTMGKSVETGLRRRWSARRRRQRLRRSDWQSAMRQMTAGFTYFVLRMPGSSARSGSFTTL